jgi:hypothetical protein
METGDERAAAMVDIAGQSDENSPILNVKNGRGHPKNENPTGNETVCD